MLEWAHSIRHELVEVRRDFHRHPELSFQETRTAETVARYLETVGLEVRTGVGGTGVVGVLRGGESGRTLAIRADMDALPIQEETGRPFASENPGVMHACGHDAHMAIVLGAAKLLAGIREDLQAPSSSCSSPVRRFRPAAPST